MRKLKSLRCATINSLEIQQIFLEILNIPPICAYVIQTKPETSQLPQCLSTRPREHRPYRHRPNRRRSSKAWNETSSGFIAHRLHHRQRLRVTQRTERVREHFQHRVLVRAGSIKSLFAKSSIAIEKNRGLRSNFVYCGLLPKM